MSIMWRASVQLHL